MPNHSQELIAFRMLRISKLVLYNLIVLGVLILIVESMLRLMGYSPIVYPSHANIIVEPESGILRRDSLLGYRPKPGRYRTTIDGVFEYQAAHDTMGRRITCPDSISDYSDKPQIWMLGCSYTYGVSNSDDEVFSWLLQEKLDKYQVVNWGIGAQGTLQFYLLLEEALRHEVVPHVVILNHADFHLIRNVYTYQWLRYSAQPTYVIPAIVPYAELDSGDSLMVTYKDQVYPIWPMAEVSSLAYYLQTSYENHVDQSQQKTREHVTQLILEKIYRLCKENDIKLVVTDLQGYSVLLKKFAADRKIPLVDISVNLLIPEHTNAPYDSHPNAIAHRQYADKLYAFLEGYLEE